MQKKYKEIVDLETKIADTKKQMNTIFSRYVQEDVIYLGPPKQEPEKTISGNGSGYVYFIQQTQEPKLIKIGYTKDIKQRMRQLKIANPCDIILLGVVTNASYADEKTYHTKFAFEHVTGEWFVPSARLIKFTQYLTLL